MLIPQFSIRSLLIATTVAAVIAMVAAAAIQRSLWAIGVIAALGAIAVSFGMFAAAFLFAWSIGRMRHVVDKPIPESPFATHKAPPQMLVPEDLE